MSGGFDRTMTGGETVGVDGDDHQPEEGDEVGV